MVSLRCSFYLRLLNFVGEKNWMKEDILMEEIKERITAINYIKQMLFKLRKTDIRKLQQ